MPTFEDLVILQECRRKELLENELTIKKEIYKLAAEKGINVERVNHPQHYNIPGRKECIEEMIDKFGIDKVMAFCELNAYKYEYRHELKGGQEDLQKAEWYRNKLAELGKQKWDKYINDK